MTSSGGITRIEARNNSDYPLGSIPSGIRTPRVGVGTDTALDTLIGGDEWKEVFSAANQFHRGIQAQKPSPEQEALKVAELWIEIARKFTSATSTGFSTEAAEWAIQKSLAQLKEAESLADEKEEEF
jgi:hypothetical protein